MGLKIHLNIEHRTWQQIERGLCVTSQKKTVLEYSGRRLRDVREASFCVRHGRLHLYFFPFTAHLLTSLDTA